MRRLFFRRLALFFPVLAAVSVLSFLLLHAVPGDPVEFMLGDQASEGAKAALRHTLHLDRSLPAQYLLFLRDLLGGRLVSLHAREPVLPLLLRRFLLTALLALAAMTIAAVLAVPLGTLAAVKARSWIDHLSMAAALGGVSLPTFWVGPLLILLFAYRLDWLPVSGARSPLSIVLPALTLGLVLAGVLARMTRASLMETLGADYVLAARARGLGEGRVLVLHALRNALIPVITLLGSQFGALLSGSIIVEGIFGWPGIGQTVVLAVKARDFPTFQGAVLVVAGAYLLVNLLTDLAYGWADPRMRA